MFRRAHRSRLDRVLAAVEVPALGVWVGALCGFAFISAPAAFRTVSDAAQVASLTSRTLVLLADVGYVCGALAVGAALLRSRDAADRTNDILRAGLVVVALVLVVYLTLGIVPAMAAISDFHSEAFTALHARSTAIYGGVIVLDFAALVMAAVRSDV